MDTIFHYFRLLQFEVGQMAQQLNGEVAGLLAVVLLACGMLCLRGHVFKR